MKKQHGNAVFIALFILPQSARSQNDIERYVHAQSIPIAAIHFMLEYLLAPWTKIYDGVFYIKEMYGCKEIK